MPLGEGKWACRAGQSRTVIARTRTQTTTLGNDSVGSILDRGLHHGGADRDLHISRRTGPTDELDPRHLTLSQRTRGCRTLVTAFDEV